MPTVDLEQMPPDDQRALRAMAEAAYVYAEKRRKETSPTRPLDPKNAPVDYAEWLADKLHATNDYGKEAAAVLPEQARRIEALRVALERIEVKAQAGLCYFTLASAREYLKDVRDEVADALGRERPER